MRDIYADKLLNLLSQQVLDAMAKMAENHATPGKLYLPPAVFNIMLDNADEGPKFMGLDVRAANLMPGVLFNLVQGEEE